MSLDGEDWVMLFFVFTALGFIGNFVIDFAFIDPILENNAQKLCEEEGHETFISYTSIIFATTPRALVCGTMEERLIKEGKIKAYVTNGDKIIVQETRA